MFVAETVTDSILFRKAAMNAILEAGRFSSHLLQKPIHVLARSRRRVEHEFPADSIHLCFYRGLG